MNCWSNEWMNERNTKWGNGIPNQTGYHNQNWCEKYSKFIVLSPIYSYNQHILYDGKCDGF